MRAEQDHIRKQFMLLRKALGLSQSELATAAGLHRLRYCRIESGDANYIKLDELSKIRNSLEKFGVEVHLQVETIKL